MNAKYEVSTSYSSKVIAKVKVDNIQTNRQTRQKFSSLTSTLKDLVFSNQYKSPTNPNKSSSGITPAN